MDWQQNRRYVEIWRQYSEDLWRFILSRLREGTEQEDILQETFLALYQKLETGEDIHNIRAWLYKTAHYQCMNKRLEIRRNTQRLLSLDDELWGDNEPRDEGADPSMLHVSDEQVDQWRETLLQRLEKQEREFLEDSYVCRLPVTDIMHKWNLKADAVYQRQRRLRLKMQRMVREFIEENGW